MITIALGNPDPEIQHSSGASEDRRIAAGYAVSLFGILISG
jgi:hypothetical protein